MFIIVESYQQKAFLSWNLLIVLMPHSQDKKGFQMAACGVFHENMEALKQVSLNRCKADYSLI
jgi:hypothetical protein